MTATIEDPDRVDLMRDLSKHYELVTLKGDRICCITRMAYTFAVLIDVDEVGYRHRYCYESMFDAATALAEWSGVGEPYGWHRDPVTGRRRPDGDHEREYVHW